MANILITEFMDEAQVELLSVNHNVTYDPELYKKSKTLIKESSNAHALIVRNKTNVDEKLLNSMNHLKVVGRLGVGLDNIDVDFCDTKNIPVIIADGANARSVSEYIIMGLLTLFRGVRTSTEDVLKGEWNRNKHTGSEVNGKTLGIIGVGTIGQIVAENAGSLGMNLIGNDIEISEDNKIWKKLNIKYCSFEEVVSQSDAITIHVPLTKKTSNLFSKNEFKNMQKGSFIINSSRGDIVNEEDIVKFLKDGHLGGAMLDVFKSEPIDNLYMFSGIENLILTPHIAGLTCESNIRVSEVISNKILKYLASGEE